MSLDDRIRAVAHELAGSMDLAPSVSAYWQVEERYRTEMSTAASAAALHRRAVAIDAYLDGEDAAREGHVGEAEALFATAARGGIGESPAPHGDPLAAAVAAAKDGGRLGVEIVLEEIRPFIHALATTVSGSEAAEDLTRVICLAVVTALPEYDPRVSFLEFVHAVASRLLAGVTTRPDHGSTAALRTAVAGMLRQLPREQRDVLVLRIFMGFSAERTAEVLRTTPGAARVAQHRALARLRAGLDPLPRAGLPAARTAPLIRREGADETIPEASDR